ncbi:MAG: UDP-3-O-(3-hydroxymyristoyl)glucosamine N-acyltransferase [Neisseria sp.]|uniref:UDP-3-O-(3-hydroxymyristoyl)glucosamine N-acyltransferase n=1 Tax=Neisseria sp. TaxID=192066 RepID=UPI0026DC80AA|nr:UDP-3-O-(3-hydroxymyristoyl)glucosamine N-acyltransferase [Neisseria sp.]MDO4640483.1 UDP-3-O-(3-hydroxymyristoyl)glucosamine N-acyltransferase [Neisseria sp.]
MKSYTLSQIVAELGAEYRGEDVTITGVRPLDNAQPEHIGFLANPKYKSAVVDSAAGAVIVSSKMADEFSERNLIIAPDPYLYFAKVARLFSPVVKARAGVHPTAVIEPSARVPASCEIGAHAYIGANTVLGEACRILAGAVVEHDCQLGDGVVIHPNAVIYYGCKLGNRVEIHGGSVIGADGFGLAFAGDSWFKIPQTGGVTLHDDVEIGANSMIDRGAMADTAVGRGTKIDNQVQIGHNCQIGEHTVIAACAGISGSTKIGSYCIIGGAAMFVGHIEIADKTTIGGGTAVTHSIKESGYYATCYPLQTHKDWARNAIHIRHLSEMSKKIKQIEKDITMLQAASEKA